MAGTRHPNDDSKGSRHEKTRHGDHASHGYAVRGYTPRKLRNRHGIDETRVTARALHAPRSPCIGQRVRHRCLRI